jgi:hypothetical protein
VSGHSEGWIPDDEIVDRRAYEERLAQMLAEYARTTDTWNRKGLRLTRAALVGAHPDTLLHIRVEQLDGEIKLETSVAVWYPGNGRVTPDRTWRWTAEMYAGIISDGILEDLAELPGIPSAE